MIIVTGATGALNGATAEHLLADVPARDVAVVVRDRARAARWAERGVEVRVGDYADPASLVAAFRGADQLLLVSASDPRVDAVALHRNAVEAAVQAGVGRVLYTSHQGAAAGTPFGPGRDHAATEALLEQSGLAWTSLRNGFYAHSLTWLLGDWRETGVITVPADGPVSWTDRSDLAEAAARILVSDVSDESVDGRVTLTASSAPTFGEIAAIASEVASRSVQIAVLGPEDWVAQQVAQGRPEPVVRFTLGLFEAAAGGFFAGTGPMLGRLLGREPRSVRQLLQAEMVASAAE